jgi:hypothetical protein
MVERRVLRFATLDEVMPDVDQLRAGHCTVGEWTLGYVWNPARAIGYQPRLGRSPINDWRVRRMTT